MTVTNNVRNFVLPICDCDHDADGSPIPETASLVGTCFLIGDRGFALTAAHVLHQVNSGMARVFVPYSEGWEACLIETGEVHPDEDIGILKFELPFPTVSPVRFAAEAPFPSAEYHMWAYPDVIAKEYENHERSEGALNFNPSPVYFRGYIRRKIRYSPNPNISIYVGSSFFEVSEIGGACCSGAPLYTVTQPPEVFGLYIGEENTSRRCGYAANLVPFLDWVPASLGKPLREEIFSGV